MISSICVKRAADADSKFLKLRVVFGSGSYPYSVIQGKTITRSTTGKLNKEIGPSYKKWYGSFRVKEHEDSGYATRNDLETWMNSDDPDDHKLVMRDYGYVGESGLANAMSSTGPVILLWTPTITPLVGASFSVAGQSRTTIKTASTDGVVTPTDTITLPTGNAFTATIAYAGHEFDTSFVCDFDPQGQVPYMDGSESFYLIAFEMEER